MIFIAHKFIDAEKNITRYIVVLKLVQSGSRGLFFQTDYDSCFFSLQKMMSFYESIFGLKARHHWRRRHTF